MNIWDIALFIFILNISLSLVNLTMITTAIEIEPLDNSKIIDEQAGRDKISSIVGEDQNSIMAAVNWLTENVYLSIQGIGAFISILLDSTVFAGAMYFKFMCVQGVDCGVGTLMWTLASGLSALTYLVYTLVLLEMATGKTIDK